MDNASLQPIVSELVSKPGHEKVRTLLHKLLTDGLGAESTSIDFEKPVPEVRGRIDALLGRTVFEVKSDLKRESNDATTQLGRYLPDRERATGTRFLGVATDGATFRAYEFREDAVQQLGPDFKPSIEEPRAVLGWLESVVTVQDRLPPDIQSIRIQLGRESVAYQRALRDLGAIWGRVAASPEATLKRDLWNRLLSVAYGADVGDDALFLQHTYLTIVAKAIATLALTDRLPDDPEDLMTGAPFRERGIAGAVEGDFFDWVLLSPEGRALTDRIARHVARFDFASIDMDILKGLYESLIDPAQRHDLGEYYTPDWLAARIITSAVRDPLSERVIDPACGSGTFLFHAIRRALDAADAAGLPPAEAVALAVEKVAGIDVHPVAVIFARATYLLALAPTLREGRPASLTVPVYLGDALQWSAREFMGEQDLEIIVPAEGETDVEEPEEDAARGRVVLRFPFEAAENPGFFDEALETMLRLGEQDQPASAFRGWLTERGVKGVETLVGTYQALKKLRQSGRNHIWGYVARNLSRPIWLASDGRKADVVVGNPPWLDYRRMNKGTKRRFREEMKRTGLWDRKAHGLAFDLSAYFFARAVQLYMKTTGRIALVMPYAALSRAPYRPFLKGAFKKTGFQDVQVVFTEAWALPSEVWPLFPVPARVLFAERSVIRKPLPATVRAFAGSLPRRDANEAEAASALKETEAPWPSTGEGEGSPYGARFNAGAKLDPRRLVLVNRVPGGTLGDNPSAPLVEGRTGALDKAPWKDVPPPRGPVEAEFLRPVYLGESIGPFRVFGPVLGVIPCDPETGELIDSRAAAVRGHRDLSAWLEKVETLWDGHGKGVSSFSEKLDFYSLLRKQFPITPIRVVYAKAGVNPASTIIVDGQAVIDHKLYWMEVRELDEALYLCSIFNSETTRSRAEQWQSTGQWGARDFDKVVFNLPIPLFDAADPGHAALAAAAGRAEGVAAEVALKEGEHFTRARRRIRAALAEDGIAAEIDAMVAGLLDGGN